MALKQTLSQPQVQGIGRPETDTGERYAYQSFGDLMSDIYRRTENWRDKEAAIRGQETARADVNEATMRGEMWSPQTDKRGIYWERYNETGLAAQASLMEADIAGRVQTAAARNAYDLETFNKEMEKATAAYDDAHPILRDLARLEIKKKAQQAGAGIQANITNRALDQGIAEMTTGVEYAKREMFNAARAGDIGTAGRLLAEVHQRVGIMENLYHLDPKQAEKMRREAEREIYIEATKGDFERAAQRGQAVAFMTEFQQADSKLFTPEEREKLDNWMYSEITKVNALVDRNEKKYREALKREQDANMARLLPHAFAGEIGTDNLETMRENGQLSPEGFETLYKIDRKGPDVVDDRMTVISLHKMSLDGTPPPIIKEAALQAVANQQLTVDTYTKVVDLSLSEELTDVTKNPRYKAAVKEAQLLVNPGGPMAKYAPDMAETELEILRDLHDRFAAGEDPRKVIDEWRPIVKRRLEGDAVTLIPTWAIQTGPNAVDYQKTKEKLENDRDLGLIPSDEELKQRLNTLEKLPRG